MSLSKLSHSRARWMSLPEPFGTHTQYIIPHAETQTIPKSFKEKGARASRGRGTWPPANMQLLRPSMTGVF
ncbi:MAG: hypothetical protein CM1200mP29_02520 [Verrucomicrobiota bacterium]|nr:MAG: hypothetical protein CM1200mP29_02520 [Verrucomicrobiota bacterium]